MQTGLDKPYHNNELDTIVKLIK